MLKPDGESLKTDAHSDGRRGCNSRHVGPNLNAEVFMMKMLFRIPEVASDNDSKHSTLPYIRNKAIKLL